MAFLSPKNSSARTATVNKPRWSCVPREASKSMAFMFSARWSGTNPRIMSPTSYKEPHNRPNHVLRLRRRLSRLTSSPEYISCATKSFLSPQVPARMCSRHPYPPDLFPFPCFYFSPLRPHPPVYSCWGSSNLHPCPINRRCRESCRSRCAGTPDRKTTPWTKQRNWRRNTVYTRSVRCRG